MRCASACTSCAASCRTLLSGQGQLALGETVTHDLHGGEGLLEGSGVEVPGEWAQWLAQQRERRRGRTRQSLAERAETAPKPRKTGPPRWPWRKSCWRCSRCPKKRINA
jgi:hypothetical protein